MPNIAICYFGLTRAAKLVYKTHYTQLYDVLDKHNITYDVYVHTWDTPTPTVWMTVSKVPIDPKDPYLYKPLLVQRDDEDIFMNAINVPDYFYQDVWNQHGNESYGEWPMQMIKNHLCMLESQRRVTNLCKSTKRHYDYIMYIRPDVQISSPFDVSWIEHLKQNKLSILVLKCHPCEGYCDAFAMMNFTECDKFATRSSELKEFRQNYGRIVSEKCFKYFVDKYYPNKLLINFQQDVIKQRTF